MDILEKQDMTDRLARVGFAVFVSLLILSGTVSAQKPSDKVFVDAVQFPLYGKVSDDTNTRYERLPASLSK